MLSDDPAQLIPQLLRQMIELGQLAQQISHQLGGNGHCPQLTQELLAQLAIKNEKCPVLGKAAGQRRRI